VSRARCIAARTVTIAAMTLAVAGLTQLFSGGARLPVETPHAASPTDRIAAMADAWTGEIDYAPSYAALDPAATAAAEAEVTGFNSADDYGGLPRTTGHETVAAYCASCHTLQIVMAQRQSREGWDYLLTWMAEQQGMAPPPTEVRSEIIDYLAREFGE
jgi:hypothetical protein